ncbi:MAG: hypothetical protein GX638_00325, partial [Crenarchaeota archaeon]|nr:hypothetical protein [Thermoproteota archaeon]
MSTIRGSGQAISKAERCSKYEIALILTRIDIKGKLWKWEKVINFSWDKNSEFSKLFRMMELQNRESENVIDEIVKICNEATICYAIEYSKSAMEIVYATRIYKDGFQTKIRDLQFSIDVQKKIDIYIESLSQNQKEIINIPEVQQLSPTLKNQNDKKVINIDQLEEILLEFVNRNSIQSNQDNKEKLDKIRNAIFYGC